MAVRPMAAVCAAAALMIAAAPPARAQTASISGNLSPLVDRLRSVPRAGAAGGREATTELRMRAIVDAQMEARPWLRFRFAGVADGLVADRGSAVRDAPADLLEAWGEI